MSTTMVNTFPPLHALDSPKSWFLASILLLHAGFFWALNNGFTLSVLRLPPPQTSLVAIPDDTTPVPPERLVEFDTSRLTRALPIPVPTAPQPELDLEAEILEVPTVQPSIGTAGQGPDATPQPVVVEPAIPRTGLSTPRYPPAAIRAGQTGTVVVAVYVLEDGRVGNVKLVSSSGHELLDQSALREARKWRFVPGTRDGIPVARWRQVPVKFELATRM